ncbi:hypothetical protein [Roseibium sp. MMSF_3544]|uniref:hypothetical protein n=1 Tax=unclassified Roseibium TaxID=2629323 RepID=UPI00273DEA4F|nr:hypothetical protein [Roseibium sp. MMSF_3544]
MSDEKKDSTEEKPEQLTDEQLDDVVGAGKFTQAMATKGLTIDAKLNKDTINASPGFAAATLFAGDPDKPISTPSIKGTDKLKR